MKDMVDLSDKELEVIRLTGAVFTDESRSMAEEILRLRGRMREAKEVLRVVRDEVRRERREARVAERDP